MKASAGLKHWKHWVDTDVQEISRWHSTQRGVVRTSDLLGDSLVAELRSAARAGEGGTTSARCGQHLQRQLREYELEPRLLLKLADTGRAVQAIERVMGSALGILNQHDDGVADSWRQQLQDERQHRVRLYELLLADKERMRAELGDEQQQLELQTRLRHNFDKYSKILAPGELDLMSMAFDAAVQSSGVVVTALPVWFATTLKEWSNAETSAVGGGEEACLRQASLWAELQHPNVRKFYGACHVGREAFVIHEASVRIDSSGFRWTQLLGCALGIAYVHERGLAHQRLRISDLLSITGGSKGRLSGMGLIRIEKAHSVATTGSSRHDQTIQGNASCGPGRHYSTAEDVLTLGFAILQLLKKNRMSVTRHSRFDLASTRCFPLSKPRFLSDDEWDLLQGMCAPDPADRISMMEVAHQMAALANQEKPPSSTEEPLTSLSTVDDVRKYEVSSLGQTLVEVFEEAELICDEADLELAVVHRPVLERLANIYEQLLSASTSPSLQLMDKFSDIVQRFFVTLERRTRTSYGYSMASVASLCASKTVAGRNYGTHHDIDRLLRDFTSNGLDGSAAVHQWQPSWKEVRQRQQQTLQTWAEDPSRMLEYLESDVDRSEALALLKFEANSVGADKNLVVSPSWYIPPHLVQLGRHLADGSFGAVYEGTYVDTPVVVKQVLVPDMSADDRKQFLQEAELWFSLNHMNLIKLYGACHEGRPFFVCERATGGTIVACAESEPDNTWMNLWQAAWGLQHLHDQGIVHGDLKGNNILVGEGGIAKLADFGLSFATGWSATSMTKDGGPLGAFRWKAPEVLQGGTATFASDIYSFGMCIIEAVTGQFPWGNSIPDAAVKFHVVERREMPHRPVTFTDEQWDLVTRMCCYDPEERLTVGAVVNILSEVRHSSS